MKSLRIGHYWKLMPSVLYQRYSAILTPQQFAGIADASTVGLNAGDYLWNIGYVLWWQIERRLNHD